jgi:prevent-host-death family protein
LKRKRISIGAGEFKARCLQLMDDVQNDAVEVIITKRGVPVARMVPVEPEEKQSAFGWMKGSVVVASGGASPRARAERAAPQ